MQNRLKQLEIQHNLALVEKKNKELRQIQKEQQMNIEFLQKQNRLLEDENKSY